ALAHDEARHGFRARMVLLHDAEDLVDPAALSLLDRAMNDAEFVQLPVLPLVQRRSRWVSGHYCDEFAEAHDPLSQWRGQAVRRVRASTSSMWRTTSISTPRGPSAGVTRMRAISVRSFGPARARVLSSASSSSSCSIALR